MPSDIAPILFFSLAFEALSFFTPLQTIAFGFAIGLIGCFKSYNASKGTGAIEGSVKALVVMVSLIILVLN